MRITRKTVGNAGANEAIWKRIGLDDYSKSTRFKEVMEWLKDHIDEIEFTNKYGDVEFKEIFKLWEKEW